jgi:hypothetical protein
MNFDLRKKCPDTRNFEIYTLYVEIILQKWISFPKIRGFLDTYNSNKYINKKMLLRNFMHF